jgi:large subunit ribosomal protein L15
MQLHQLKPIHKNKQRKRVGRGGKRGTYSGRGMKGQKSRAGRRFKPVIRELIKKYPKLRGYRFNPIKPKPEVINLGVLDKQFKDKEKVNPKILVERKIIGKVKGKVPKVKILGQGALTKSLIVQGCQVSKIAKEKIIKAKGKVYELVK